jgi:hypothetical protein
MKIYFERSGGFAGMLSSTTVDTENLPSKEAIEIKNLVEKAHFFELPSKLIQSSSSKITKGAADYFVYKITIQNNNNNNNNNQIKSKKEHSVECNDLNMQPTLRPLIDFLTKYFRK